MIFIRRKKKVRKRGKKCKYMVYVIFGGHIFLKE